jgi:hypothetical protein
MKAPGRAWTLPNPNRTVERDPGHQALLPSGSASLNARRGITKPFHEFADMVGPQFGMRHSQMTEGG